VVGRNAIRRDENFRGGQYLDESTTPAVGLAIARIAWPYHLLVPQSMREKFGANRLQPREFDTAFEKRFSVGSYLAYQGDKFVERFDANSYIKLSLAMDLSTLGKSGNAVGKLGIIPLPLAYHQLHQRLAISTGAIA